MQLLGFKLKWLYITHHHLQKLNVGHISAVTDPILARAVAVPVGRRLGGRLATTLVATKNVIIFRMIRIISPSRPFLIEGEPESKNIFNES